MSAKVTPWFPGSVNPDHVGVYQRKYPREIAFCYWDGFDWSWGFRTANLAQKYSPHVRSNAHDLMWRGLAKKP